MTKLTLEEKIKKTELKFNLKYVDRRDQGLTYQHLFKRAQDDNGEDYPYLLIFNKDYDNDFSFRFQDHRVSFEEAKWIMEVWGPDSKELDNVLMTKLLSLAKPNINSLVLTINELVTITSRPNQTIAFLIDHVNHKI